MRKSLNRVLLVMGSTGVVALGIGALGVAPVKTMAAGLIDGRLIVDHSVSADKLTASAVKTLSGQGGKDGKTGPAGPAGPAGHAA
jgi:hypothetical protein